MNNKMLKGTLTMTSQFTRSYLPKFTDQPAQSTESRNRNYAAFFKMLHGNEHAKAGNLGKIKNNGSGVIHDQLNCVILGARIRKEYMKPWDPNAGRPQYYCKSSDGFTPDPNPTNEDGAVLAVYAGNRQGCACRMYNEAGLLVDSCPFAFPQEKEDPATGETIKTAPPCKYVLDLLFIDEFDVVGQLPVNSWYDLVDIQKVLEQLGDPPMTRWVTIRGQRKGKSNFCKLVVTPTQHAIPEGDQQFYIDKVELYKSFFELPKDATQVDPNNRAAKETASKVAGTQAGQLPTAPAPDPEQVPPITADPGSVGEQPRKSKRSPF
jgi:hypothetical protein